MKDNNFEKANNAVQKIAEKENISVEEVRREMKLAITEGLRSADPDVREMWKMIPCKGDTPEPEEVITWVVERLRRTADSVEYTVDSCGAVTPHI